MDYLVRLFRTLANARRLAILRLIASRPDSLVTGIAAELGIPQSKVSAHLKLLFDHGIVEKRPTGACVLTKIGRPRDARHEVLKALRRIIQRLLGSATLADAGQAVCSDEKRLTWDRVYETMCFDFTAYTHLRRLLVLRFLDQQDAATLPRICREIGMSHMAAWRQTDKLIRRGILCEGRAGRTIVVDVCREPSTWLRRQLLTCVLAALRDMAN